MYQDRSQNRIGLKYGRLTVLRRSANTSGGSARWVCLCNCGIEKIVLGGSLASGVIKSCGCFKREFLRALATTHGESQSKTREYRSWRAMKDRCYVKSNKNFWLYGGRGIKVCERWIGSFENFLADMGRAPSPRHSIDRFPDQDGDYKPGNCRWATQKQQMRNARNNRILEYGGRALCVSEWAEELGIRTAVLFKRISMGWPVEQILSKPVQAR